MTKGRRNGAIGLGRLRCRPAWARVGRVGEHAEQVPMMLPRRALAGVLAVSVAPLLFHRLAPG